MPQIGYQSRSLTINAVLLTLAKSIAFSTTILLPILLVRQMDQKEFGLYKQVFLAVNTMITTFPLGFAMSAFYFLPREPSRRGQVIFNIVVFHFFVGTVAGFALVQYPEFLAALFDSPDLVPYGREIGVVVFFWMLSSFLELVAVAQGETYLAAIFVVGAHFSRAVLLLGAAVWIATLQGLIHAALFHGILQTGFLWLYLNSRFPKFWRQFDWALMRSQLAYGMPLGIAGLLWMAQTDLHNYFVSHRFGPAAYAIYAIGCFQLPFIGIVREAVGALMISRVSELRKNGDAAEILSLTARMMRKMALVLLPMFLFLFVTRREVIIFLFTDQYLPSIPLFAINLWLIPLSIISAGYDPILRAYPEYLSFFLAVRAVLSVVLVMALGVGTASWGMEGAITVVVGINLIERVIVGLKVGRILEASWKDVSLFRDVGKLCIAALLAGVVTEIIRQWVMVEVQVLAVLLISAAAFGITYVAATLLLGILTSSEREALLLRISSLLKWVHRRDKQNQVVSSDDLPSPLR